MKQRIFLTLFIAATFLASCGQAAPTVDINPAMTQAFATVNASYTQTALAIPTSTPLPTETPTPTEAPKPTEFAPTVILTATVLTPSNVRFGPGTDYAGPGGLRTGKTLEVIGRNEAGDWLLVRETGGKKSSWVYASNLSVQGDIASLGVAPVVLPIIPNYQPPANIRAARAGGQVQISWDAVTINYKDAYPYSTYFLETWTCSGGQLLYSIHALKETTISVDDQAGCADASHGLLYTTTRDGYSTPAQIPWPAP